MAKYNQPSVIYYHGVEMREFPVPIQTVGGRYIPFSWGGCFRMFPYQMIAKWTRGVVRDLDAGQPMSRKFRPYVGLKGAEGKLRRYLGEVERVVLGG